MRFSAATANAHRIHYDHPYATAIEGYPGLAVLAAVGRTVVPNGYGGRHAND